MLAYLPFLISANSLGIISLIVFIASAVLVTIPAFATRGGTQVAWFGAAGFVLLVEAALLVTLGVLTSQGEIFQ